VVLGEIQEDESAVGIAAQAQVLPLIHQVDQGQHQVPDKAIPTDSIRSDTGTDVGDETGRLQDGKRGF